MIRLLHTACAALLVMVALVAYGVKEETAALRDQIVDLEQRKADLHDEIAMLRAEWSYLNGPDMLARIAARVYGEGRFIGADGGVLQPWRPEQLVELRDLPRKAPATQAAE